MEHDLLLLHGALGTQAQFAALTPLLADGFRVHTLDFEGHGGAPRAGRPFLIAHFAENVSAYLDARGIARARLFGYSMGGYVAVYLALTRPERVAKVFTLATQYVWTPEVAAREAGLLDADRMLAKVPRYAESLQQQHGADWRAVVEQTKALLLALGEDDLLAADALKQVACPVRVSVGDRDAMVSVEDSLGVYRALPQGEFQVFPNTPHPFDRVSPDLVAHALARFLA